MKNLFIYFSLLGMTFFGMWSSLTWDIPVDNQMFMFVLSLKRIGVSGLIPNHLPRKRPQPRNHRPANCRAECWGLAAAPAASWGPGWGGRGQGQLPRGRNPVNKIDSLPSPNELVLQR